MKQYLIDASVLHGWSNTKDKHHSVCKKFFQDRLEDELFFPIHCLFEVKASRERRLKGGDFSGLPGKFVLRNKKFINVDRKFFDHCQQKELFDAFKKLKGSDLIYACMAKIGGFILVTCDNDFDAYSRKINLLKL
ncbi:MAG: PIN domain-containing protein [Minisyncoccales bacterium]